MKTPAGLDERCRQDPWSQANQGGPKKRSTFQEYPFVRWMFPSGGIHVDQDRRKKAGLLPWAGRGPGAARQSI